MLSITVHAYAPRVTTLIEAQLSRSGEHARGLSAAAVGCGRSTWWILAAILLGALSVRLAALLPPGYALDEEITSFAVDGIRRTALPVFPSGALNDRGVAYSYAAWASGTLFGYSLTSYRLPSVIFGAAACFAVYFVSQRMSGSPVSLYACLLLAAFPPHIQASGWARFYSLSAAAYIATVAAFMVGARRGPVLILLLTFFSLSLLSHELTITLLLLPIAARASGMRRESATAVICSLVASTAAVSLPSLLHFLAPNQDLNPWTRESAGDGPTILPPLTHPLLLISPATSILLFVTLVLLYLVLVRKKGAPPLVLAFLMATSALFQLGWLVCVLLCAMLLRPERARVYLLYGAVAALATSLFWTVHTIIAANTMGSFRLWQSLTEYSLTYPWPAFIYLLRSVPLSASTLMLVVLFLSLSREGASGDNHHARLIALLVTANLALLGILNVPLTARYFLVTWPVIVVLLSHAVTIVWGSRSSRSNVGAKLMRPAAAIVLAAGMFVEQYRYGETIAIVPGTVDTRIIAAPRVESSDWATVLEAVPRDALVISNDELASMYHIGRIDGWLAADRTAYDQYAIEVGSQRRGVYANALVLSDQRAALDLIESVRRRPWALVLFATGRFDLTSHTSLVNGLSRLFPESTVSSGRGIVAVVKR